jgi:hypothetical protein
MDAALSISPAASPAQPLEYYRPSAQSSPTWQSLTNLATVSQWHQTRAVLGRANVPCRMAEGIPVVLDRKGRTSQSFALLVPEADLPRAAAILRAMRTGRE